jgi:Ca-activated chloride channel homolog
MISYWNDISFTQKEFLWLFCLLPVMIIWYILRLRTQEAEFNFSSFQHLGKVRSSFKARMRHILFVLRLLAFSFLILVLARPQSRSSWSDIKAEGIDIVMSLDVSYSMLAKDFKPNRFDAAKEVAKDFIDARPNDRIGLVIFGGEAFTQCPLTTDHNVLKNLFGDLKAGMLAEGTAIGLGIADAVARVKESKAKSKVVILLSDGVSNVGEIAPLTAGEIAKTFGVRVYTIGVGTKGKALMPVAIYPNGQMEYDYVDVEIDEKTMSAVAEMTGGKYFRATDNESLHRVYKEIDKMEKTIISEKSYSNKAEKFLPLALVAAALLLLEFLLRQLIFKSIP